MAAYDLDVFINKCLTFKTYVELYHYVYTEVGEIDKVYDYYRRKKDKDKLCEWDKIVRHRHLIGEFLAHLNMGLKPMNLSYSDFNLFKPIIENCVKLGQMKPEVLKCFEEAN